MRADAPQHISSRDNAFLKDLRRLAQDNTAYRKQGRIWLESDHLCRAALARGVYLPPSAYEVCFLSMAHDTAVLAEAADALVAAAKDARGSRWPRSGGCIASCRRSPGPRSPRRRAS